MTRTETGPQPAVTLVGLGPSGLHLLPEPSLAALREAPRLVLRTARHPAADELRERGIVFTSLDSLYDTTADFADLYPALADAVLREAEQQPVTYAVPGHPLLGEESVRLVLAAAAARGLRVEVLPAPGFVDVVLPALVRAGHVPEVTEWQVADAAALERVWWSTARPVLIFQVDDAAAASRAKLALLAEYGEENEVFIVRRAGDPERESVLRVPLYQVDRPEAGEYEHLTTLYLPALPPEARRVDFQAFVDVVATLRSPAGCPWDREQTYASLKRFVLEEAYEVLEAVDAGDPMQLADELGDLMLQVLLYSQIGAEEGYFDIRDVMTGIVEKLIRRHPHVFGDVSVENSAEVLRNWEAIKRTERPERTSVLDGVPRHLPALMKALEVSKRVVKVGFEWPTLAEVLDKIEEEVRELREELPGRDPARLQSELGDLLFTVVNVARWLKLDPEEALRQMVERFSDRFREVETLAAAEGRSLESMDLEELDRLWERAKRLVAARAPQPDSSP
jgi:tetrapyrrole methylase family protein / MazG family protein